LNAYYDTGILLKLYTAEPESDAVREFVTGRAEAIPFLSIHRSECASALHLRAFRGECSIATANRALGDIDNDVRSDVLRVFKPDWEKVWWRSADLAQAHAAVVGCRTLDTLHVASALEMGFRLFVSSDSRQAKLAERIGLEVSSPL